MPSSTPGRHSSTWTFASPISKRSSFNSPARRSGRIPKTWPRNEPAHHQCKSRREAHELLPRENHYVLHDCVSDHSDTRVRHDIHEPGPVSYTHLRAHE